MTAYLFYLAKGAANNQVLIANTLKKTKVANQIKILNKLAQVY